MFRIKRKLQMELLTAVLKEKIDIIEQKGPGAYMVSVFGDSEQIAAIVENNIFDLLMQMVASSIIVIMSLRWSSFFALIVISAFFLLVLAEIFSSKRYQVEFKKGRELVYEVNPKVLELIENRNSILGYSDANQFLHNLEENFIKRDKFFKRASEIESISVVAINAIKMMSLIAFFVLSLFNILEGKMEISSFIALMTCFTYVFLPISSLKQYILGLHKFDTIEKKISGSLTHERKTKIPKSNNLVMDHCSYRYNDKVYTIQDITINPDNIVGIVGLSGEGKTSIIKMIMGEIVPEPGGTCMFGEKATHDIPKMIIHSAIRYYMQDDEIFDADVKYNVVMNKEGISRERYQEIINATFCKLQNIRDKESEIKLNVIQELLENEESRECQDEFLGELINELKTLSEEQMMFLVRIITAKKYYILEKFQQLYTDLELNKIDGRMLGQRGNKISGGEKNKIMMARFLLPEDDAFFVIDEPFTSLDAINEAKCLQILKKYLKNSRGIIISHKLNVIKELCSKICLLEEGRIYMEGTHTELLEKSELYRNLYRQYSENKSLN